MQSIVTMGARMALNQKIIVGYLCCCFKYLTESKHELLVIFICW